MNLNRNNNNTIEKLNKTENKLNNQLTPNNLNVSQNRKDSNNNINTNTFGKKSGDDFKNKDNLNYLEEVQNENIILKSKLSNMELDFKKLNQSLYNKEKELLKIIEEKEEEVFITFFNKEKKFRKSL